MYRGTVDAEIRHTDVLMAQCIAPFYVKKDGDNIPVPCGKCPECLKRRVSGWSFRLMQEGRQALTAYFITLTYDTSTVPITKKGFMTLNKRDCQLFMKRLRKQSLSPLKYYLAGEYGEDNWRPHYHMLLFNARLEDVQPAWQNGHIHYGDVTGASIGYTLKYMCKPRRIPLHQNDDRVPEFSLMSKRLGLNYLTEAMVNWHRADMNNRMYCNVEDGKKIAMPRYYKNKVYTDYERWQIQLQNAEQHEKMQIEFEKKMQEEYGDIWPHIKAERDMKAFESMYKKSLENRKKI